MGNGMVAVLSIGGTGAFVALCGFLVRMYTKFVQMEAAIETLAASHKEMKRTVSRVDARVRRLDGNRPISYNGKVRQHQ